MKEEFIKLPLIKNEEKQRFELAVDGHIAFIEYEEIEKIIRLIHTESPGAIAGRGVATALIENLELSGRKFLWLGTGMPFSICLC